MTRNKVKHVAIPDESTRKSTLSKRIESLFKKANELSTLCDVNVVAIVQDPKENDEALWPSREEVEEKLSRFLTLPDMEKSKKMTTQESYLVDSLKNKYEKIKRLANKNDEREMAHLMKELINGRVTVKDFDVRQTDGLAMFLRDVLKNLERKNQELHYLEQQHQSPSEIVSHSHHHYSPQPQQPELPFIAKTQVDDSHDSHHSPEQQQQQQQQQSPLATATHSYHVTLDTESIALLSNDDWFMDTMFEKQDMMDFHWEHFEGFAQTSDAPGKDKDMGFDQTIADSSAQNEASSASPNENVNSYGDKKE